MDACVHYQSSPRSGENFDIFTQENAQKCIKLCMDACFHYQSPRSGENFDTFMQENAQTCIKMNACFHYHS